MSNLSSSTSWDIGLNSWIIQDGNYPDFEAGQIAEFAVEFWIPEDAKPVACDGEISAKKVGAYLYDTVAEVVLQTDDITILDIGILVYNESSLPLRSFPPQGTRFAIQLGLGVDPFFYFESLCNIPEIPPLIYSWKISSVLIQTKPFLEIETVAKSNFLSGGKALVQDPQQFGYKEIPMTDAWHDNNGSAEYLFLCDLLPIPTKRSSATAT
jgi:hypothetical protein